MAMQNLQSPIFYGAPMPDVMSSSTVLDANGEYVAWVFEATATGTIDRVHFNCSAKTADGDGLRVRIETVSLTDGFPTGTLVGGSSEVTIATTSTGWNRSGAGLNAAVTRGDVVAVKLLSPGTGTTFNGTIIIRTSGDVAIIPSHAASEFPYIVTATPAAAKTQNYAGSIFAVEYSDGSFMNSPNILPLLSRTAASFGSDATPDERGVLFQLPFRARCMGAYMCGSFTTDTSIVLYDASSNALATASRDGTINAAAGVNSVSFIFPSSVVLEPNTDYRIVCKPLASGTSVSLNRTVIDTAVGTTNLRQAFFGSNWKQTTRTNGGAWTDVADTHEGLGLMLDQLDDGASAITLTGLT